MKSWENIKQRETIKHILKRESNFPASTNNGIIKSLMNAQLAALKAITSQEGT